MSSIHTIRDAMGVLRRETGIVVPVYLRDEGEQDADEQNSKTEKRDPRIDRVSGGGTEIERACDEQQEQHMQADIEPAPAAQTDAQIGLLSHRVFKDKEGRES